MVLECRIATVRQRIWTCGDGRELAIRVTLRADRLLAEAFCDLQQQAIARPAEQRDGQPAEQEQYAAEAQTAARTGQLDATDQDNQAEEPADKPSVALYQLPFIPATETFGADTIERSHGHSCPMETSA